MGQWNEGMLRTRRGNMLAMVGATALLLIAVLLFGLSFLSLTRGNMEQRSAIESAALVAAQDIGRIVVSTDECGLVGLCDQPPVGSATQADDRYFVEVRSVNELLATARLNCLIAEMLGDMQLKKFALQDRANALAAKDKLVAEIQKAIKPGGSAKDAHGNPVRPYEDAEAFYLKNQAKVSAYIPNSLKLTLGNLEGGIATQVSIPNPDSKASVNASQKMNSCYVSELNIPCSGTDFVFASTGKSAALGDLSKYRDSISGLPYQIPAVVKADADQKFFDQGREFLQHFSACATAGSDVQHPLKGALTVSFPDGPVPELACPRDLLNWSEMQAQRCDILTSENGDFPVDTGSEISPYSAQAPDWISSPPSAADVCRLAIFDWLRAAGSRVNIDSVVNMLGPNADFDKPSPEKTIWKTSNPIDKGVITVGSVPAGILHIYSFNNGGNIVYRSKPIKTYPYTIAAHKQLYAELQKGKELKSKVDKWKIEGITFGAMEKAKKSSVPYNLLPLNLYKQSSFKNSVIASNASAAYAPGAFYQANEDDYEIGGKGPPPQSKGGPDHSGEYKGGGGTATFELKTADIEGTENFDFYARDMVRNRGALGGYHQGEIMDSQAISYLIQSSSDFNDFEIGGGGKGGGSGAPPIVSRQDDFASDSVPMPSYQGYSYGPEDGAPRPTYVKNGIAVELRFRRQVKVGALSVLLGGFDVGYIGEML